MPPVVRLKAASLGIAGQCWLEALPEVITDLEQQWSITVGAALSGGTAAYVARARTGDGNRVVLKISIPDPGFADEAATLSRAEGRGYVHLLAHDVNRQAMLLEELGPSLAHVGLAPEAQLEIMCQLLKQAWAVRPPEAAGAGEAHDKATSLLQLVTRLWAELDHPCPEHVFKQAISFGESRAAAFRADSCVVLHGDAAAANALQVLTPRRGAETGFVFVDPDGFIGDPAYDLGVALRDWSDELLASRDPASVARRYCRLLAEGSGISEQAIWEWGYLERVSTGLYTLAMGAKDLSRPFLKTAELLLDA